MRLTAAAVWLGLLLVGAGYLGALHPAGDSLAVFRPVIALALIAAGLVLGGRLGWTGVAAGVAALLPILWMARPQDGPQEGLVIYQKNLLISLADPAPIVADIRDSRADIVLLQEVGSRNRAVAAALQGSHPHQVICDATRVGAVAILSRLPLQREDCIDGDGMVTAQVMANTGPVTLVSLHLHWPWPYGQSVQLDRLLPRIASLQRPVVVGGDFNMVPWSRTDRRIAEASGTHPAGPVRPSRLLQGVYPMPIDRLLIPDGWQGGVRMRETLGSDHRGMLLHTKPQNM